jgi:hypothetical protein
VINIKDVPVAKQHFVPVVLIQKHSDLFLEKLANESKTMKIKIKIHSVESHLLGDLSEVCSCVQDDEKSQATYKI